MGVLWGLLSVSGVVFCTHGCSSLAILMLAILMSPHCLAEHASVYLNVIVSAHCAVLKPMSCEQVLLIVPLLLESCWRRLGYSLQILRLSW